jgi:hypothetical protein
MVGWTEQARKASAAARAAHAKGKQQHAAQAREAVKQYKASRLPAQGSSANVELHGGAVVKGRVLSRYDNFDLVQIKHSASGIEGPTIHVKHKPDPFLGPRYTKRKK